jgi:hypothetical protein
MTYQLEILNSAYSDYYNSHSRTIDGILYVMPIAHSKESFIQAAKSDYGFDGIKISERDLTWSEQVQWVMHNTNVELENLAITEAVYNKLTPVKMSIVTSNNGKIAIDYIDGNGTHTTAKLESVIDINIWDELDDSAPEGYAYIEYPINISAEMQKQLLEHIKHVLSSLVPNTVNLSVEWVDATTNPKYGHVDWAAIGFNPIRRWEIKLSNITHAILEDMVDKLCIGHGIGYNNDGTVRIYRIYSES